MTRLLLTIAGATLGCAVAAHAQPLDGFDNRVETDHFIIVWNDGAISTEGIEDVQERVERFYGTHFPGHNPVLTHPCCLQSDPRGA